LRFDFFKLTVYINDVNLLGECGMVRPKKHEQVPNLKESIKEVAWQQMVNVGAAELSLRAIARAIGVSAPAIYNHYADRDALVTALIIDAYTSLGDYQMTALDVTPLVDLRARLRATGQAYRTWALDMPQRYQLIFGTPIPGYQAPPEVMPVAGRSLWALVSVIDQLYAARMLNTAAIPAVMPVAIPMFDTWQQHTGAQVPEALTVAIMIWGRVHGLISLEINCSIPPFGATGNGLYEYELDAIAKQYILHH
jgi:AcrR family transcriptional regulator